MGNKYDEKAVISEQDMEEIAVALEEEANNNPKITSIRAIESGEVEHEAENDFGSVINAENPDGEGIDLYEASIKKLEAGDEEMKAVADQMAEKWNIPPMEMMQLYKVADRYRKNEKFSIYNSLPNSVKHIVNTQIMEAGAIPDNQTRSMYCGLFMEEFISEFVDKYLDKELVDFNKSIQETLGGITNVADMYSGHIRYMMEVDLKKKAEETDNASAKEIYLGCSQAFTDSWTYRRMLELIANNSKVRRKLYKENFQFNRFCNDLDFRNKDSKFSIRNSKQLYDAMMEHLGAELDISSEDCKAFTILFIKSTYNLDMRDVRDAMYVYYVIFNIVNLGFDTNKSKFYHAIVNNIKKVFNAIWENTGDSRRFEIEDDINWIDDEPSAEDIAAFEATLNEEI